MSSTKKITCGKIRKENRELWAVDITEVSCDAKNRDGCTILSKDTVTSTVYARRKLDLINYCKKHNYEPQENL